MNKGAVEGASAEGTQVGAPGRAARRGFILPLTLLALLALSALALAAWTLATAEHQGVGWERGWLAQASGPRTLPGPAPAEHVVVRWLPDGYRVVAAPETPGFHHLAWCLDPAAEAGGAWIPEVVAAPPRLGPLAARSVAPGWGGLVPLPPGSMLPGFPPGDSVRVAVPPGGPLPQARVAPGGGGVLLLAPGSLHLAPVRYPGGDPVRPVSIHGAFIIGGDLSVDEGLRLVGGLRLGGTSLPPHGGDPHEGGGGASSPPPVEAREADRRAALALLSSCPDLVHLLGRLGRF